MWLLNSSASIWRVIVCWKFNCAWQFHNQVMLWNGTKWKLFKQTKKKRRKFLFGSHWFFIIIIELKQKILFQHFLFHLSSVENFQISKWKFYFRCFWSIVFMDNTRYIQCNARTNPGQDIVMRQKMKTFSSRVVNIYATFYGCETVSIFLMKNFTMSFEISFEILKLNWNYAFWWKIIPVTLILYSGIQRWWKKTDKNEILMINCN